MRAQIKRRLYLGIALLLPVVAIVIFARPAPSMNDHVGVRVLSYTNDSSGLQALVQFTNSYRNLSWSIHTEILTNGVWTRSSSQPVRDSYPPMLAAELPDFNVLIPVPIETATWRVELEVRPYDRGKAAQVLSRVCKILGVRDPFYPADTSVRSEAFKR